MVSETSSMSVSPTPCPLTHGKLQIVQIRPQVSFEEFTFDSLLPWVFLALWGIVGNRLWYFPAGSSPSTGSSRSISIREMMQKAVMAARAANLDVDDDTAIPTLHWPPDPPVINTTSSTAGTTPAAPTTAGATSADTPFLEKKPRWALVILLPQEELGLKSARY